MSRAMHPESRRAAIYLPALTGAWFALAPLAALAQDDSQVWAAVFASGPVEQGGRVLVWMDVQSRFRDKGDELDTTIVRPGIGWRVSPRLDIWGGYAHIASRRPGPDVEEHRLWQQATYPIVSPAGGRLTGRTRLEQRFRIGGDDTGWRLRQFLRWSRPIGAGPISLVASNETFMALNDTDWGQNGGLDQNRAFVGAAWQATTRLRLEAGFMNQQIEGGPRPDRQNDNLVINAFTTF